MPRRRGSRGRAAGPGPRDPGRRAGGAPLVDLVVPFDEDTPAALIATILPDVLFKGADYAEAEVVGADFVKARGGRVELLPLLPGHSTTATVARLEAGRGEPS